MKQRLTWHEQTVNILKGSVLASLMVGVVDEQNQGEGSLRDPFHVSPRSNCRQLFIYTGAPLKTVTDAAARLFGGKNVQLTDPLEFKSGYVTINVCTLREQFRGHNNIVYIPPFGTRVLLEELPSPFEAAGCQSELETCINRLLETFPGRCVVWNHSSELYRKGF